MLGGEALGLSPPKDVVSVLGFLWLETEVLSHIMLYYLVLTKLYSECSSEFYLADFHTPEEMVMLASWHTTSKRVALHSQDFAMG